MLKESLKSLLEETPKYGQKIPKGISAENIKEFPKELLKKIMKKNSMEFPKELSYYFLK